MAYLEWKTGVNISGNMFGIKPGWGKNNIAYCYFHKPVCIQKGKQFAYLSVTTINRLDSPSTTLMNNYKLKLCTVAKMTGAGCCIMTCWCPFMLMHLWTVDPLWSYLRPQSQMVV